MPSALDPGAKATDLLRPICSTAAPLGLGLMLVGLGHRVPAPRVLLAFILAVKCSTQPFLASATSDENLTTASCTCAAKAQDAPSPGRRGPPRRSPS